MKKIILFLAFTLIQFSGYAQYIYTIAGNGTGGIYAYAGDNGPAILAELTSSRVALDGAGNIYFADYNYRIRKVNAVTGIITTIAGNGAFRVSGDYGLATSAGMNPSDIAVDDAGNIYIADNSNHRIRKVTASTGIITTIVGNSAGYSGDNMSALKAQLSFPSSVALDNAGNIYIADSGNYRIRKVNAATGIITTVAGTGTAGSAGDGGAATSALLYTPSDIAVDVTGNIYITDFQHNKIRKISPATGIISTVAGTGLAGYSGDNGPATAAKLNGPGGITVDNVGNVYFSEGYSNICRKITAATGIITSIAGTVAAYDLAIDASGNIYISGDNRIRKLTNAANTPTTTIVQSFCQDQGATVANLAATGTALKWYNVPIGGTPLISSTVLGSLTYYVSQTVSGIESARAPLTVTFQPMITPDFTTIAPVCSGTILSPLPKTSTNAITGTWSPAWNNLATTTYTFTPAAGKCATTTTKTITITGPTITPTFATIASVCKGKTLSPLPTTSINGITGSWSPALNNTSTTTYTFTPTPITGQCLTTNTLTIVINAPTTPAFTQVATVCSGTTLSPLPTTSNNAIKGTWSPDLNNTATTYYSFTPDVGQCATPYTGMEITITPPTITPTFASGVIPTRICEGATLLPLPTTSTNGIIGTWDLPVNNTFTTFYTFTPAPNQCARTTGRSITVNYYTPPTFYAVAPVCSGATSSPLLSTSNEGIAGSWSPNFNNLTTTTYTFTPTPITGQCFNTNTLTIEINTATIPTGNSNQNFVPGNTIANIAVNPTNVVWYPTYVNALNNTYPLSPATLLFNGATYYAVNVVGDCRSDVFAVTVNNALGVNENFAKEFAVYPNPAKTILTLQYASNTILDKIVVTDLTGKIIIIQKQNASKIDVAHLASGIYIIEAYSGNKKFQSKFVKE